MRPRLGVLFVATLVGALIAASCATAAEPLFPHAELVSPESDAAVARGLAYLADRQLNDGSFGSTGNSRNVAVVGLTGMAFLGSGSGPRPRRV